MQDLGLSVWCSGFRVQGLGFRVQGVGFRGEGAWLPQLPKQGPTTVR